MSSITLESFQLYANARELNYTFKASHERVREGFLLLMGKLFIDKITFLSAAWLGLYSMRKLIFYRTMLTLLISREITLLLLLLLLQYLKLINNSYRWKN